MTIQQLETLLIDQAFGELPEEVDALLESLLVQRDDLRETAAAVREAIQFSGEVVSNRPGLFRTDFSESDRAAARRWPDLRFFTVGLKMAAAVAVLALAAGLGYRSGHSSRAETPPPAASTSAKGSAVGHFSVSPWARYQVESDGRLAVITSGSPRS